MLDPEYIQPNSSAESGRVEVSICRLSGVGALWECVPRVCSGGGGCAGGGVPLGAVPVLSWCGEVSLWGKHIIISVIASS